jgi:hypothetical protein
MMTEGPTLHVGVDDIGDDEGAETGRLIRPYAITGGRTGAETDIGLEAQIQASTRADELVGAYRWEAARLIELVQAPMALIEIAARLEIPIGVARVLVADLVADGAVVLHMPQTTQNFTSLLERVLDGVRNL